MNFQQVPAAFGHPAGQSRQQTDAIGTGKPQNRGAHRRVLQHLACQIRFAHFDSCQSRFGNDQTRRRLDLRLALGQGTNRAFPLLPRGTRASRNRNRHSFWQQKTDDRRQLRTDYQITGHRRHGTSRDAATEPVAHDEVVTLPKFLDERHERREIVAFIRVASVRMHSLCERDNHASGGHSTQICMCYREVFVICGALAGCFVGVRRSEDRFASPRRNHQRSRNSGISDRAKKNGPPFR